MHEAWSGFNLSTQHRHAEHAALYRGMDFCWWKPQTRDACQSPPQAHIHEIPHTFSSAEIHTHTHTHRLDQQFILTGLHSQAAPHTVRSSMMRNGLASWGEWTATAWGRRNDWKERLPFIWERCAHTSFLEQQGHVRGKVPMSPSLIGAYLSALSLSHYGRSRMLC